MKFSIERDEFLKALNAVQGVVEKRNTMPILANLLMESTDNERLRITATDLEIGITSLFPARVISPGKITLNARNLTDITKQLPSQEMLFQLHENCDVEISCGKTVFKLHGLPAEDFPSLPQVDEQKTFPLAAVDLATMIDYTAFSVSTDETRYNLSGVFLEKPKDNVLRMVSSDGHRLSLMDRTIANNQIELPENIIIPRKGLMEIRKICSEIEGDVEFAVAKSNCVVLHGDTKLVIRLIDGEFPDYRQVLPSNENQKKVTLDREIFLNALKRISILSQEKTRGVRFQFERDLLKVNVNNPDLGEAEEEIEIRYNEKPLEIGFNAKYFIDVLNLVDTETIDLYFSDSMSQGLLVPTGNEEFKAVVMPMKLL
jgi:DNA polymerase-3 subunit beta